MEHHVFNASTEFEDPTAIRSWVMCSYISHTIPLTMCSQPVSMHRITCPMHRSKFSHIYEIPDSLCNIYGATKAFKVVVVEIYTSKYS